jgi:diaminopimelate decarboxylase
VKASFSAVKRASKAWLKQGLRRAVQATTRESFAIAPRHWDLDVDANGGLSLAGVGLDALVQEHGSPLHVVNTARLRSNARRYLAPTADGARAEVFYSYKTNPVPGVLDELHRAGVGAEVISHYELWLALKLGVAPDRIVYNGPAKSEASVRLAIQREILLLNVNHREEIAVVAGLAAELGRRPKVGLRVTLGGWAGQFGMRAADGSALAGFEEALANRSLDVVALHVHRGGMIQHAAEAETFVTDVLAFVDELREKLGFEPSILDLGGSLGSPSVRPLSSRELRLNRTLQRELLPPEPSQSLSIEDYTGMVLSRVHAQYRRLGKAAPRVFLEPGRSLTSDAQLLLTRVMGLKREPDTTFAICDAGINLAESCRSEYHQVFPVGRYGHKSTQTFTLVGPICTPGDTLRWAARLPSLAVGDTLAIMDAGAYFVPFSTSFSFPRPAILAVDSGQVSVLRRAETFDDLSRLDDENGHATGSSRSV